MSKKCCGKWKKNNKHCSSCPIEEECKAVSEKIDKTEKKMKKKAKKAKKEKKAKKDKSKKKKK
jgi:adenine-specific DNA glycosylase